MPVILRLDIKILFYLTYPLDNVIIKKKIYNSECYDSLLLIVQVIHELNGRRILFLD